MNRKRENTLHLFTEQSLWCDNCKIVTEHKQILSKKDLRLLKTEKVYTKKQHHRVQTLLSRRTGRFECQNLTIYCKETLICSKNREVDMYIEHEGLEPIYSPDESERPGPLENHKINTPPSKKNPYG